MVEQTRKQCIEVILLELKHLTRLLPNAQGYPLWKAVHLQNALRKMADELEPWVEVERNSNGRSDV